jgi:ProP effector
VAPEKASRLAAGVQLASPEAAFRSGDQNAVELPHSEPRKQQPTRDKSVRDTLAVLREWHPKTFVALTESRRLPLKVGIRDDIVARVPVTETEAAAALRFYCNGFAYLKAMQAGEPRVDLDGVPVGEVTVDEAAFAQLKIGQLKERVKAKAMTAKAAGSAASASPAPTATAPMPVPPRLRAPLLPALALHPLPSQPGRQSRRLMRAR